MSRPIARHSDGSDCYTVGCSLGTHIALDAERDAFVAEGLAQQAKPQQPTQQEVAQRREAARQAEFKQEWKERISGWKDFGFQYPISVRTSQNWLKYADAGREALARLTERQRKAIEIAKTENFFWIQRHLYGKGEPLPSGESKSFEAYDMNVSFRSQRIEEPTRELAEEIVPVLDEALSAKQAEPRVLYRGLNRPRISRISGEWPKTDEELHAYVDENFKLGSEVQFDGYLSASASPNSAMAHARNVAPGTRKLQQEGVFFELLTRSGVNVASSLGFNEEAENLLPRNTRWKVAAVHKSKRLRYEARYVEGERKWFDRPNETTVTIVQMVEIED